MPNLMHKRFAIKWARTVLILGCFVFWSFYMIKDQKLNSALSSETLQQHDNYYKLQSMDIRESIANISTLQLYQAVMAEYHEEAKNNLGLDRRKPVDSSSKDRIYIHVMPHSHVDPGWLKKFHEYFDETNRMLDLAVDFMPKNPNMTFMWAEISFLQEWWDHKASETQRAVLKRLVADGRFDILNGGWTMTDEASPHFWASVNNLIEGHQFLLRNFGMIPGTSWSNDPFGYGPTMPALFQSSGVHNFVIGRIHAEIKEFLRSTRNLEFLWQQVHPFAADSLVHSLPYGHYDVLNSCGPNPSLCCQFDFRRLKMYPCPGPRPVVIDDENVREKATALIDQLRQQAAGYQTNQVLFVLGDDFRYHDPVEWHDQYVNFAKLMNYTNGPAGEHLNAELKFSTISRFFAAMKNESTDLLTVKGDFFPYTDNQMDYWTGYFTSRPWYKKLDRIVQAQLRSANIISVLALGSDRLPGPEKRKIQHEIFENLQNSRRQLALFQHHDAVTGTSKQAVMKDYGVRLVNALSLVNKVLAQSASILTSTAQLPDLAVATTIHVLPETYAAAETDPPESIVRPVSNAKHLVRVINSDLRTRKELIRMKISQPNVELTDLAGNLVPVQIQPSFKFDWKAAAIEQHYEIIVPVELRPLSIMHFLIRASDHVLRADTSRFASVSCLESSSIQRDFLSANKWNSLGSIVITSGLISAKFSTKTGLLQSVKVGARQLSTNSQFVLYRPNSGGAYIFRADQTPQIYDEPAEQACVIQGPILSEVHTFHSFVWQRATLSAFNIPESSNDKFAALAIQNVVSISETEANLEVAQVFETSVENDGVFYTDSMGFQILKRQIAKTARVDQNYYPIAASVHIEDDRRRFTVLTGQPHGVTSGKHGQIQLMLDRRLGQDDQRGMGEPVHDNVPTASHVMLLWEHLNADSAENSNASPRDMAGYMSPLALHLSRSLLNPVAVSYQDSPFTGSGNVPVLNYVPSSLPNIPCDMDLLDLRTIDANKTLLMILHRRGLTFKLSKMATNDTAEPDSVTSQLCPAANTAAIPQLLDMIQAKTIKETSLTGAYDSPSQIAFNRVPKHIDPMNFVAYKIEN